MESPESGLTPFLSPPGPQAGLPDSRLADMEVTDAAFDAWAWGSRREDLPEWLRLELQQPCTLYALLAGIQDGLSAPPASPRESLTQRISHLAEATLTRLIEELLAEEAAQAGTAAACRPPGPPVTAAELSIFIGCAVDEALAQALDDADGADLTLDPLLEPRLTQRVLAEAMQYFSPTPHSSREELEVLAFRCARNAVDRVLAGFAHPSLSP